MSFWSAIKSVFVVDERVYTRSSLQNPSEWMYSWFGGHKTRSGVAVNSETALAHTGVFACAKILSDSVASLPVGLFGRQSDQIIELTGDTRHRLLSSEPSELYTSFDFRSVAMLHLALHGNFYADIIRDGNRRPVELRLIENPNHVNPELDPEGKLWYKVSGRKLPVRPFDILHVKGLSSNGLVGRSPIGIFRENIGLGLATTETQGSLWKNGASLTGYLKHPANPNPDQLKNISENWTSRYGGRENAGKTPVLSGGMEFVPLTLKPQDAMFLETAKLSLHDICRIYRIPPHMVGDLERSTNNNIEHQSLEFVRDTLRPWLKNWEQELNRKLLFDSEKSSRFFHFNVDGLLRGDTKSRAEYFTRALGSVSNPGWMSPNEVRALENLNPVEDGDSIYNPTMNNTGADASGQDNQSNDNNADDNSGEPGASATA